MTAEDRLCVTIGFGTNEYRKRPNITPIDFVKEIITNSLPTPQILAGMSVEELSDRQKLALCMHAGLRMEIEVDYRDPTKKQIKISTVDRVAIVKDITGKKFKIYTAADADRNT